jgi:hypothetical protein
MPNTILTGDVIVDRMLAKMSEVPTFLDKINTQYDSYFSKKGAKVGDSVRVKKPQRATIRHGRIANLNPINDQTITVSLDDQVGVDVGATSAELSLDIDDFDRDYITPNAPDLVAAIESAVLQQVVPLVPETVGDYGAFDDMTTVLQAGERLDNNLTPKRDRIMLLNPRAQVQVVPAFSTLFNDQRKIGEQYRTGRMSTDTLGFDWYGTTLMPTHTRGTANGGYLTNSVTPQTGSTLIVDTGTGTIQPGDTFTINGVFAVHPQTKESLGYLREFTVTTAHGGGAGTLQITPAIVATGSEQNVSNAAANDQAIVVKGTSGTVYGQNLAFSKDAFYFVTADLPVPKNMEAAATRTWKGINIRYVQGYDITNDMFVSRFDVIYGGGILREEQAVRIPNSMTI